MFLLELRERPKSSRRKDGNIGLKSGSRSHNFRVYVSGSFLNLTVCKDYICSYFLTFRRPEIMNDRDLYVNVVGEKKKDYWLKGMEKVMM
jgi:hypothetical protein